MARRRPSIPLSGSLTDLEVPTRMRHALQAAAAASRRSSDGVPSARLPSSLGIAIPTLSSRPMRCHIPVQVASYGSSSSARRGGVMNTLLRRGPTKSRAVLSHFRDPCSDKPIGMSIATAAVPGRRWRSCWMVEATAAVSKPLGPTTTLACELCGRTDKLIPECGHQLRKALSPQRTVDTDNRHLRRRDPYMAPVLRKYRAGSGTCFHRHIRSDDQAGVVGLVCSDHPVEAAGPQFLGDAVEMTW